MRPLVCARSIAVQKGEINQTTVDYGGIGSIERWKLDTQRQEQKISSSLLNILRRELRTPGSAAKSGPSADAGSANPKPAFVSSAQVLYAFHASIQ